MIRRPKLNLPWIGVIVIALALGVSYVRHPALRWTQWELSTVSAAMDAPPGAPVARTWELGLIDGRIRWLKSQWLTTPHVPNAKLALVPPKDGFSATLHDADAWPINRHDMDWSLLGFGYGHGTFYRETKTARRGINGLWQANITQLCLPLWPLFILVIAPGIPSWIHRRARRGDGYCRQCGYDLRATPDRCPECGQSVSQSHCE